MSAIDSNDHFCACLRPKVKNLKCTILSVILAVFTFNFHLLKVLKISTKNPKKGPQAGNRDLGKSKWTFSYGRLKRQLFISQTFKILFYDMLST